jgi:SNF2 family DNA or RNA helicase
LGHSNDIPDKSDPPSGPLATAKLPYPLRNYQVDGLSFFMESEAALLADEMGLGKTVQTILAIRFLYETNQIHRALVVTPRSLCTNWVEEFETWAPNLVVHQLIGNFKNREVFYYLPIPVLIGSYEQIRLDTDAFDNVEPFDLVVLDEAQRIKNVSSKTSLACRALPRRRSWALTGTPLENRPDDLLSIFRFVHRTLLQGAETVQQLHSLIKPHFLRRTKSEVLPDLPPILKQDLNLTLSSEQRSAYESAWSSRRSQVYGSGNGGQKNLLAVITRLKQICNLEEESGESTKLEALQLILDSQTESTDKVLVFSQYVETLKWIAEQLHIPCKLYHGGMKHEDRDTAIEWFRETDGPCVFLISLKAGGVGLNLQEASTVVLFDRWWNPAAEEQAIQRAHRFGRKRPLHVIRFLVKNTIEERIDDLLKEKQELFDQYVEQADSVDQKLISKSFLYRLLALPPTEKQGNSQ